MYPVYGLLLQTSALKAVLKTSSLDCATEKAHDSRGMDVMGTLDLSIQGWFINPDDIVRTLLWRFRGCLTTTWFTCV